MLPLSPDPLAHTCRRPAHPFPGASPSSASSLSPLIVMSCLCATVSETRSAPLCRQSPEPCPGSATPTRLKHCRGRGALPSVRLRSNSLPAPPSDPLPFPLHAPSSLSLLLSSSADPIARHMPGYSAFPMPPSCPMILGLLVAEAPAAALRGCRLACGLRGAWDTQHHKRRVRQADSRHTNISINKMYKCGLQETHTHGLPPPFL